MPRLLQNSIGSSLRLALCIAGIALCWYARHVLFLVFAGILLAILLQTVSSWAARGLGTTYGQSFAIVVALLMIVGAGSLALFGTRIVYEISELSQSLPESLDAARERIRETTWGKPLVGSAPSFKDVFNSDLVWSQLGGAASSAVNALFAGTVVLFVGIYGAASPKMYVNGIVLLFPASRRKRVRKVLSELGDTLRWWMVGHLITMLIVGVLIGIGLSLLGVPQPIALALVAFVAELVPNFGPVVAAIPAILLAWSQGTTLALYVVILYSAVQVFESYLILPLIQKQVTSLPPALTIVAVVLFGLIGGVVGAVVATPAMLSIYFLTKTLYVEAKPHPRAVAEV